jgi:hypothetical protein
MSRNLIFRSSLLELTVQRKTELILGRLDEKYFLEVRTPFLLLFLQEFTAR